ncbi:MAG: TetR/AcrR family transcriptional regulator [Candidatus Eisenbacteria bacterium]|nr:TetR/AcrR family transcriptional regulator [Candidatus Eisenbacteria bacterium]
MTIPDVSRRERKKDETRQRIFRAAVDLFREKGFEATTIDDITERSDVAKGTFFNYFPRKDSVLGYFSDRQLEEVEANLGAVLAGDLPVREKLHRIYGTAAAAYSEDRELSRFILVELMSRAFSPAEESAMRWHDMTAQILTRGIEAGEMRSDMDPLRAEAVLTGVYFATVYTWACGPDVCPSQSPSLLEELRQRLDLVFDGLAV